MESQENQQFKEVHRKIYDCDPHFSTAVVSNALEKEVEAVQFLDIYSRTLILNLFTKKPTQQFTTFKLKINIYMWLRFSIKATGKLDCRISK